VELQPAFLSARKSSKKQAWRTQRREETGQFPELVDPFYLLKRGEELLLLSLRTCLLSPPVGDYYINHRNFHTAKF
jgi:hypothetical protein